MITKRLVSVIAATTILTLGVLGSGATALLFNSSNQVLQRSNRDGTSAESTNKAFNSRTSPMLVAQASTCYPTVISASFNTTAASGGVNIRSAPSLNASIIRRSGSNEPLSHDGWTHSEVVTDLWLGTPDARWYKLRGQNAWVASAVVSGNPPNSTAMPSTPCGSSGNGQINLPYAIGQTWYVCQGYQGGVSHLSSFAFDLTVAQDFGASACWAADGNVNKSAGRQVLAPAAGTVTYVNTDLVCLSIDSNRSLLIGHINRSVPNGQRVSRDTVLGTVSSAAAANGGYAHIHIEPRKSANCAVGTSVPFTAANGFQLNGTGDLPDLAGPNDYFKRALRRP